MAVARRLHDDGVPVELHIVGCDPPAPLPAFVHVHGHLSKRDPRQSAQLWRLFQEASFFILPSRAECFGIVFCEAAAYGLPTIATTTGGIPEILGGGDWGIMLAPDSPPEAFARWIRASRTDTESYARMAWAARRDYEERLNWPVFCRELVKIVESIERERR
jgi:glycosyltransferase involved in cell wall biosynthesis